MARDRVGVHPSRSRLVPRRGDWYGWMPDLPDHRDLIFRAPSARLRRLPARVDLRRDCPPVYNQGRLQSCTANAIAAALEFDRIKQRLPVFRSSRLFIYYNERVIEHSVRADTGAMIRDGIKSVAKQGAPHERLWPYALRRFRTKPSARAYHDAHRHPAVVYQRLTHDLDQLRGCLATGYPFVFGLTVYESFESKAVEKSGRVPLPRRDEKMAGGHAMLAVGYDHGRRHFIVRNSWGRAWGLGGYCFVPYAYLLNAHLSEDFWTIDLVA